MTAPPEHPRASGIAARGLDVQLGGRPVLADVALDVPRGAVTGLLGPSGVGKSTLLRALVRLVPLARGLVTLDGEDVAHLDPRVLRRRVGLVAQAPFMLEGTVLDNLRYANEHAPHDRLAAALDDAGLAPELAERTASGLSGGERSRVALARALARDPEVLLLDEPTAALDHQRAERIGRTLRGLADDGRGVLLTTHDEAFAGRWADRVVRLP